MAEPVHITLIGGGWSSVTAAALYSPFLRAAGDNPTVACLLLDEGHGADEFTRWQGLLTSLAPCRPIPLLVAVGELFEPDLLVDTGADALLVGGGLTPAYAHALVPVAADLRTWLAAGRPYAGFSAGAAIASRDAILGGWLLDGHPICPADAGEDLDEITVSPGLGLIGAGVDVHADAWGTLSRAAAAVQSGLVASGLAIEEETALIIDGGAAVVAGAGGVHQIAAGHHGPVLTRHGAGSALSLESIGI
ncbi:cyanophycinase [Jatrophihabitans sp. GAS493]|uniref:Type 1 glutamine amidotransferase-like domain-containing protein n=1 Tax=Jatrophihabitans sp. GAS493 TaxID=1907575 RepID=UPI000BC042DA|nr:Type 1 glutamine amidotransferase-like domain-containing protein [Jatrophihabitans sp. GAS493]SOD71423.1 cyanophycinase [Jatrophihabitans sp. GAS493]